MKIEIRETFVDKEEDYKIIQKGEVIERNKERAEELINLGFAILVAPAKEKTAKEEKAVVKTKEEKATKKRK